MNQVTNRMLDKVNRLEQENSRLPQVSVPLWHYFAPGLYARQMLIRAGITLTGAVHKSEHICIVSGNLNVTDDQEVRNIQALQEIFVSLPGTKRAMYAIDDTYFTTVHATTETDLEKLVSELTHSTAQELIGGADNVQLINNLLECVR
jgi:hypothetical protein